MMGIFKIFSSDSTLNDQTQMPCVQQYSAETISATSELNSTATSISDQISLGSTDSNDKFNDNNSLNILEETSSKEILFGSGDGSPETECANASLQKNNDLIGKIYAYETHEKELLQQIENERFVSQQSCQIIKEFEDILTNIIQERDEIIEHKDIALAHLSNLEYAFYDVTTKYERAKLICNQFRENEQILKTALQNAEQLLNHREQKYEILKKHANDKLMEANIEIDKLRKTHTVEVAKLNAVIKKSECQIKCLEQQLEQKIAENSQMARLWEDLNNNIQNENYPTETLILP